MWPIQVLFFEIFSAVFSQKFFLKICLLLAVLNLGCWVGLSLVAVSRGYSLVAPGKLLTAAASVEHGP